MSRKRIALVAGIWLALAGIAAPHAAFADPPALLDCSQSGTTNKALQQALMKDAQDRAAAAQGVFAAVPPVDVKLNYCINSILNSFGNLNNGVQGIISILNPMNVIGPMITNELNSVLNQVCSAALGAINSATNSLSAKFCVPMPNLNMNSNLGLGSGGGSGSSGNMCGGTNLLSLSTVPGGTATAPSSIWDWKLWSK